MQRCFALLGAFPARRDEALRGALGMRGVGGVRTGQVGGVGLLVLCCCRAVPLTPFCGGASLLQMIYFVLVASLLGQVAPNAAVLELTGDGPTVHFGELGGSDVLTLIHNATADTLTCSGTLEASNVRIAGTSTTVADLIGEVATLKMQMAHVLQMVTLITPPPPMPPIPPMPPTSFTVGEYSLFQVGPADFGNDLEAAYNLCAPYGARLLGNYRATGDGFECNGMVQRVGLSNTACGTSEWYQCFGTNVVLAGNFGEECNNGGNFFIGGNPPSWNEATGLAYYTVCAVRTGASVG